MWVVPFNALEMPLESLRIKPKQRRNIELLSTAAIEIKDGREVEAACRGFFKQSC